MFRDEAKDPNDLTGDINPEQIIDNCLFRVKNVGDERTFHHNFYLVGRPKQCDASRVVHLGMETHLR